MHMAKKPEPTQEEKKNMMKVMQLHPPKLKDMPRHRSRVVINCREQFGFLPELIFIDKVYGKSSTIIISGVVPKEMEDKFKENEPMPTAGKKKGTKNGRKNTKNTKNGKS